VGFLSNKEEEEYLNSNKGQDEVVQNIVDALDRYKNQVEGGPLVPLHNQRIRLVNKGLKRQVRKDLFA